MKTFDEYLRYKTVEQFLDSLVLAKPVPYFVAARHNIHPESPGGDVPLKNPFGLERIASFLEALDSPHRKNRYIHIAGTSGKTSTTYIVAALLQSQGYRTARFISPHITTFAEYFTIDNRLPPMAELVALIERVKPVIDREYEQSGLGMISYAELMVALAFEYFAQHTVEYVALEAFLGGRHDATNIIEQAEVSILTNVGLDHTHILGDTVQDIAGEKVGIMKDRCPFLTAEQCPELLTMFRKEALKYHTTVEVFGQDFTVEQIAITPTGTVFDYVSASRTISKLYLPLPGSYQVHNTALALRALDIVTANNQRVLDEERVREALSDTHIPGRFEKVNADPVVILDAAHNPDKMASLTTVLRRLYRTDEVVFVCAFTSGRDPQSMFRLMVDIGRTFYLTRAIVGFREDEEPLYLKHVLNVVNPDIQTHIALDPFRAVELAIHEARKQQKMVCVTGSAYLVGYVRQRWYPEHVMV